jgi:hypothetical protein
MSKNVQGIENILPASLNYKQMKKSMLKGDRKTVKLFPATNTNTFSYTQNRVIEFNLPPMDFLDTKNTRTCFEAYGVGNENLAFNNHIESIINKVEILTGDGQSSIELLHDYNLNAVSNFMYKTTLNYANSIASVQEGWSTDVSLRNRWCQMSNPNPKGYAIRLMGSGLFNSALQYLPLRLLANNGGFSRSLILRITLEAPSACMIDILNTSYPSLDYVVQNMFMQLELISCPEYEAELTKKVMGGQIVGIPYTSSEHWVNTLSPQQTGDLTFQMNSYYQLAQGFKTIFKNGVVGGNNSVDFTNTYYRPLGIKNYQVKVGNKYFPTQLADINGNYSNAVQYNELLKYFNKGNDVMNGTLFSDMSLNNETSYLSAYNTDTTIYSATGTLNGDGDIPLSVNYNQNFLQTNDFAGFQPVQAGYYRISLYVQSSEVVAGSSASNVTWKVSVNNKDTGAILNDMSFTKLYPIIVSSSPPIYNTFTITDVVYLDGTYPISVFYDFLSGNAGSLYTLTFSICTLSVEFVSNESSQWISDSYLIGTTFKTWYDNEEYMKDQLEYFLDGMDTTSTNQIVFRFGKNIPDPTPLNLYHYLDYVGALVIDKSGISIVK